MGSGKSHGVKKMARNKMVYKKAVGEKKEEVPDGVEEKTIGVVGAGSGRRMRIKFQVADVKKPLMSVKRLVERGNRVVFSNGGSYIVNDKTGDRLELRENGKGSYIMDVDFVGGGKGRITVDSGAEENVCPIDWGQRFRVNEEVPAMRLRGADGNLIRHHGERVVVVTSEGF